MAIKNLNTILVLRNDSTTAWESASYLLRKGEIGVGYDIAADGTTINEIIIKAGDQKKTWAQLPVLATTKAGQNLEDALGALDLAKVGGVTLQFVADVAQTDGQVAAHAKTLESANGYMTLADADNKFTATVKPVVAKAGNGITVGAETEKAGKFEQEVSVKLDATNESAFLTVGANGLKLAGVATAINTAKAAVVGADSDTAASDTVKGAKKYTDAAKSAVIGTASDASTADTIKGAKKYTDEAKAAVLGTASDTAASNTVAGAKKYTDAEVADAKTELIGAASDAATANTIGGAKKYTDEEVAEAKAALIGEDGAAATTNTIKGAKAYADQLVNAVKQFEYEVVATLPTASAATKGKIYLVAHTHDNTAGSNPNGVTAPESYDEYITLEPAAGTYTWEKIGNTDIDLTAYAKTADIKGGTNNTDAGKTVATMQLTNGVLTTTYQDIAITANQITDKILANQIKAADVDGTWSATNKLATQSTVTNAIKTDAVTKGTAIANEYVTSIVRDATTGKLTVDRKQIDYSEIANKMTVSTTANAGLKVSTSATNAVTVDIDDAVVFVLDGGTTTKNI